MKVLKTILAAALLFALPAEAQQVGGNATLTFSSASSNVALPASTQQYPALLITPNLATSSDIFYNFGKDNTVAATLGSPALPSGGFCLNNIGPNANIAAISSGTGILRFTQLTYCPVEFASAPGSGGGGGGGAITGPLGPSTAPSAAVATTIIGAFGTPTQILINVGTGSTTVLAASGATAFIKYCVAATAANGVWVNWSGAAAVAAAPSEYLLPGQCDWWVKSTGFLPTSQINAIATATTATTLISN